MINFPLVNKGQARFGLVEIDEAHAVCKDGNKGKMTCEKEKETLGWWWRRNRMLRSMVV